jgi:hypothetical protein
MTRTPTDDTQTPTFTPIELRVFRICKRTHIRFLLTHYEQESCQSGQTVQRPTWLQPIPLHNPLAPSPICFQSIFASASQTHRWLSQSADSLFEKERNWPSDGSDLPPPRPDSRRDGFVHKEKPVESTLHNLFNIDHSPNTMAREKRPPRPPRDFSLFRIGPGGRFLSSHQLFLAMCQKTYL